ncbi:unnamed protein product [Polarella glacialis]|uniref:tRNA/rRNA methyltransferase SpoU type domain-containing protein n=2 Tax=Polarella glacialis TaxID=89957 RepID=A0A813DTJ4_POLGL|nr:unnamed protein product [Polarella glacialis]
MTSSNNNSNNNRSSISSSSDRSSSSSRTDSNHIDSIVETTSSGETPSNIGTTSNIETISNIENTSSDSSSRAKSHKEKGKLAAKQSKTEQKLAAASLRPATPPAKTSSNNNNNNNSKINLQRVISALEPLLNPGRLERAAAVLARRTQSVRVVFDGAEDAGNVAACMRTLDLFGVQFGEVVVTTKLSRTLGGSAKGAGEYVSFRQWSDTSSCLTWLKENGYRCVAIESGASGCDELKDVLAAQASSLPSSGQRFALVLSGNSGPLSEETRQLCDLHGSLPSSGFARSASLNVTCALALSYLRAQGLLSAEALDHDLQQQVWANWLVHLRGAEKIPSETLDFLFSDGLRNFN